MPEHPSLNDLRVNHLARPLGLDDPTPAFSWRWRVGRPGARQAGYRIRVATDVDRLDAPDAWDSGDVPSGDFFSIAYGGRPLASGERLFWRVEAWDENGERFTSDPDWFEMAFPETPEDSETPEKYAGWIGFPAGARGGSLCFQRIIALERTPARARLYAGGVGLVEWRVNGQCLDDAVLGPDTSVYSKHVFYRTLDVTPLLKGGAENVLSAEVAPGWFGDARLWGLLVVSYADKTTERFSTAGPESPMRWQVAPGPSTAASIFDGETFDARHTPGVTVAWRRAMCVDGPGGRLRAAPNEPIRVTETFPPRSVAEIRPGVFVADAGINVAGRVRLRVRGSAGERVSLRFAESLNPDGSVNVENLRAAQATDQYILAGDDSGEVWEPRFTYHGFRYFQIEGWPGGKAPAVDDFDIRVVRSDVPARGEFVCGDALVNRLQNAILRTEKGNQHGIPTDCPQRDERQGWANDMTVRAEAAIHDFDMIRFYRQWLSLMADAADPATGGIPDTIPHRWGWNPADPVCAAPALLPWLLYRHYGDRKLLAETYALNRGWTDCLAAHARAGVVEYSYYGDWAPPLVGEQNTPRREAVNLTTPGRLVSTAFLSYTARLTAKAARVLGRDAEREKYNALADYAAGAFHREFWDEASGGYGRNNQSANALALYFNLVPENRVARVFANLVRNVEVDHDTHLSTGNICTKYVPEVLAAHGRADLAWRLVTQTTYPSWGYMLERGATTIWERWEYATDGGMNSHNHPMLGSISAWFYRHVAGLQVAEDAVGCDVFVLAPQFVPGLDHARATLDTVRGKAEVQWRRDGDDIALKAVVPFGAKARMRWPRGATPVNASGEQALLAGTWRFDARLTDAGAAVSP